jgi:PHD/YefM family antitoxin component YafN of YafNO toxin-antitoxin module
MLRIIPNLEFSRRIEELSETCRHDDDPIILTHEGRGDLVVMGVQAYNKLLTQMRLLQEVAEANARLVEN